MQESIHRLWDSVAAIEASEIEVALKFLLESVAELIDAQNAYWTGAVRIVRDEPDLMREWRQGPTYYLKPLPNQKKPARSPTQWIQLCGAEEAAVAHARLAGNFRAGRLRDLVSPDWFNGERYQGYLDRGVHDSLVVGVPANSMSEGHYGFLRMRQSAPFTDRDRDVAYYAMRGLTWFHRKVLLAHGLIGGGAPLTPRERRVVALLLTDQPEKTIAANLGLTPATLHTYVRTVFRKLGVSGRNGLVSLWLGHRN